MSTQARGPTNFLIEGPDPDLEAGMQGVDIRASVGQDRATDTDPGTAHRSGLGHDQKAEGTKGKRGALRVNRGRNAAKVNSCCLAHNK